MLLVIGWICVAIASGFFLVGGFAAGMSTTGTAPNPGKWPAIGVGLIAVLCFLAHHYLRGKNITW